jgi:hypothetical protein
MLMLPYAFDDATFRYVQVSRVGMLAIYRQTHKAGLVDRYEVVKIRIRPAHTWPDGHTTPEHEAYPGASSWGQLGWTVRTLPEAEALMQQLQRAEEPPKGGDAT